MSTAALTGPLRTFTAQLDELVSGDVPDMDRVERHLAELAADPEFFAPFIAEIPSEAPTHMSWKVLARIVRDLIAWDNARLADLGNQLHRQRMDRPPDGAIVEGTVIPPRQAEAPGRQHNAVWLGVGLVAAARALRNRRLDEQAIAVIFALAALSQMSWKELVRAVRDLIAWDNARLADLESQLRRDREARAS